MPAAARWPGKFPAGKVVNDIMAHQDWFTTLIAAAGEPDIAEKIKKGYKAGDMTYKKYIDGLNFLPFLTGETDKGPRDKFFYISDEGSVMGVRVGDWKLVFQEQRAHRFDVWREPLITLRAPKIFNLRRDPYERADTDSNVYNEWWEYNAPYVYLGLATVKQALESVKEYPPTQKPDSWNLDKIADQLQNGGPH